MKLQLPKNKLHFLVIPIGYLALALFGLFPVILALLAGLIGNILGCNINEGGTDPCVRFGIEFGSFLASMFTMGWFGLVTLPIAGIGASIWTVLSGIYAAIYFISGSHKQKDATT